MKLDRHEIAQVLEEIATLMELADENPFKTRAYTNGVRVLEGLEEDLGELIEAKKLTSLKGIGKGLAEAIESLAKKGTFPEYEKLRKKFPDSLFEILRIPGLGPKKVKVLFTKLGITSLGELEYACHENRLIKLEGFGEKTQDKVLQGIAYVKGNLGRFLYADIIDVAKVMVDTIGLWKEVEQVSLAGSLRRKKEAAKDVDIVCSSPQPKVVMQNFVAMKGVKNVVAHGDTKSSVVWQNGLPVDLRVVKPKEFPYALHHFTGSREHNTEMRARAKKMGFKMNEYGLFKGTKFLPCKNEKDIFKNLGLSMIPPELREGQHEISAAEKGNLPTLVEAKDIRGLLHMHSTYSDGRNTIEEMVKTAAALGYEYVGISDHSQTAFYANGLKPKDIDRQHKEIDRLQKKFPKLRIFRGIESDILPDGGLDYPEKILKKFDFVIGSVHAKFKMKEDEMTERCLRALENPYCTMIGHPTGRLLLAREGFKINLHALIDRAAELGKVMELNANPHRLDLDWRMLGYARDKGVPISINPDAHGIEGLADVEFGVNVARKGWLTPKDVFNALPVKEMEKALAQS